MNRKIKKLYDLLYSAFGPRGWWPVCDKKSQIPLYRPKQYSPENLRESFEICVGAILTQNTSWKNVVKCFEFLSKDGLIKAQKIIEMPLGELEKKIRSCGYYRQKAKRLKEFSVFWQKEEPYFSSYKKDFFREKLLSLKGIGPETADSMLLYAFSMPSFVIDSYTKRIFSRVFMKRAEDYHSLKKIFESALPEDFKIYNEYHALIVETAKRFCFKKNPACLGCPAEIMCLYRRKNAGNFSNRVSFKRRKNKRSIRSA